MKFKTLLIALCLLSCASTKQVSIVDLLPPVESLRIGDEVSKTNTQTLAPFPLYFTPLGEPRESQIVYVDGYAARLKWDGLHVSLKLIGGSGDRPPHNGGGGFNGGRVGIGNGPNDEEPPDPDKLPKFWLGCLIAIIFGAMFWSIVYLMWKWLF